MKKVKKTFVGVLLFISLSSGFIGLNAAEAKIMPRNQYQKITLSSSKGNINFFAPDKCAAGDTISGKMMAEPSGKTGKTCAKNAKILDHYSVEIAGVKQVVGNEWITWTVPDAKDLTVTLLNEKGKRVDSIHIPVHYRAGEMKPRDFQCPEIVQVGDAFPITGQYNGVPDDTMVMANDQKLQLLVESSRVVIVEPPPRQTGEMEISVREGNVTKTFKTRNIAVLLHADDLHLKRGQTTGLTIAVQGIGGLVKPLPLYVTNLTRETVSVEGEGTVWITPSEVNSEDGSFTFKSTILAHSSGSFMIKASVIDEYVFALPIEPPDQEKADNGEIGDDGEKRPRDDKEQDEDKRQEGEQGGDEEGNKKQEVRQQGDEKGIKEQEGQQEGDEDEGVDDESKQEDREKRAAELEKEADELEKKAKKEEEKAEEYKEAAKKLLDENETSKGSAGISRTASAFFLALRSSFFLVTVETEWISNLWTIENNIRYGALKDNEREHWKKARFYKDEAAKKRAQAAKIRQGK
jgi:hypothetical protein